MNFACVANLYWDFGLCKLGEWGVGSGRPEQQSVLNVSLFQ